MKQSIGLTSVGNARELGGYRTTDGRQVRRGVLLRCAELSRLSQEDKDRLHEVFHLGLLIDFRTQSEQKVLPDPVIEGVRVHELSVMEMAEMPGVTPELMENYAQLRKKGLDPLDQLELIVENDIITPNFYADLVTSQRGITAYHTFFALLLELPEGQSVLWHCTDGKDRTGLAAMLLLTALGVPKETILEDYLLTNEYNAQRIEAVRYALRGKGYTPEQMDLMAFGCGGVADFFLNNAIQMLEVRYGSVDGYLSQEFGVGPAELERLRQRFLEPAEN